jgi:hypothetical protein
MVDCLQADISAGLAAALQPVLTRDALEMGPVQQSHDARPSTVHPEAWELRQLKHSERWIIYGLPAIVAPFGPPKRTCNRWISGRLVKACAGSGATLK